MKIRGTNIFKGDSLILRDGDTNESIVGQRLKYRDSEIDIQPRMSSCYRFVFDNAVLTAKCVTKISGKSIVTGKKFDDFIFKILEAKIKL